MNRLRTNLNNENRSVFQKNTKMNTTDQQTNAQPVTTRQRSVLGDIGNRMTNRTLPIGAKKPNAEIKVEVCDMKKGEAVLNALKKVEPRKPLRTTSFRTNSSANVVENGPLRHNSIAGAISKPSNVAEIHRPTLASKLKAKENALTKQNELFKKPPVRAEKSKNAISLSNLSKALIPVAADLPKEKEDPVISADSSEIKGHDAYSTAMIPNIDEDDLANPQLVSEYVNEIYEYMRDLEIQQDVREKFLHGKEITGRMRGVLVDWLVQVHVRFHLLPETMFMTTMLMDRFLQEKCISKNELQLVGVTAMFVASKYEEMYAPEIGDFVYITDNSYTKEQVRKMERCMLQTLDFHLGKPLPIHFLRRYSKAADADSMKHSLAKYFLELCIVEYDICHLRPSLIAACALWLAIKLLGEECWSPTLVYYTKYTEDDVAPVVKLLCQAVVKAHSDKPKLQAVKNKFSTQKFMEISKHNCLTLPLIRDLACQ